MYNVKITITKQMQLQIQNKCNHNFSLLFLFSILFALNENTFAIYLEIFVFSPLTY